MDKDKVPEQAWSMIKEHLGYNEEEMDLFKKNPRNSKVMATALEMQKKTIVFEVVESHGCNSQHKVGTRFFFSGDGNLISKMSPSKVCAFALPLMTQGVNAFHELWYAGVDTNELSFNRARCFDVGVGCGGWGNIILESKAMDRDKALELYAQSQ